MRAEVPKAMYGGRFQEVNEAVVAEHRATGGAAGDRVRRHADPAADPPRGDVGPGATRRRWPSAVPATTTS